MEGRQRLSISKRIKLDLHQADISPSKMVPVQPRQTLSPDLQNLLATLVLMQNELQSKFNEAIKTLFQEIRGGVPQTIGSQDKQKYKQVIQLVKDYTSRVSEQHNTLKNKVGKTLNGELLQESLQYSVSRLGDNKFKEDDQLIDSQFQNQFSPQNYNTNLNSASYSSPLRTRDYQVRQRSPAFNSPEKSPSFSLKRRHGGPSPLSSDRVELRRQALSFRGERRFGGARDKLMALISK